MDTKIKVTVYAKNLQGRLAELNVARDKALDKYKTDLATWRKSLETWIAKASKDRIKSITVNELKERQKNRYDRSRADFNTDNFFRGCPDAPVYPDDKQIREITALLRQLSITGQEPVNVSTSDVERYLLNGGKIDD